MTNNRLHEFASQLDDVYRNIDDQKEIARAIIEAAEAEGINTRALRKAAKEMTMDSDKRAKKYADEAELDQMRAQLSLFPSDDRRAA